MMLSTDWNDLAAGTWSLYTLKITLIVVLVWPLENIVPISVGVSVVIELGVQFLPEDIDSHPEVVSQHVVEPEGGDEEDVSRLELNLISLGFEKPEDMKRLLREIHHISTWGTLLCLAYRCQSRWTCPR